MEILIRKILIYIIISFFTFSIFSQTLNSDTLIIQKEPVIIKKQIQVDESDYNELIIDLSTKLTVSPLYVINSFSTKGIEKDNYINTHSSRLGYAISGWQSLRIGHFTVMLGLAYSCFSEKYSYQIYKTKKVTVINWDDAGNKHEEEVNVISDSIINNTSNYFTSLDIPIQIGYSIIKKKYDLTITTGFSPSFLLFVKGKKEGINVFNPSNLKSSDFNKVQSRLILETEFFYKLLPNFGIVIEPYFIWGLSESNKFTPVYKSSFIGFNFGVKVIY